MFPGIRWRNTASRLQEMKALTLDQVEGQRNGKEITVAALIVGVAADAFPQRRPLGDLYRCRI